MDTRPTYTVTTITGEQYTGQIQGSGGPVDTDKRLRWVCRERTEETIDVEGLPLTQTHAGHTYDRGMYSNGQWMLRKHAGKLSIWTDPDNTDPSQRLTKLHIGDVVRITNAAGATVWPASPITPAWV